MTDENIVPTVGKSRFPVLGLVAMSTVWYFGLVSTPRRKEWYDVLLDYCHHKRTTFSPNMPDRVVRRMLTLIKK